MYAKNPPKPRNSRYSKSNEEIIEIKEPINRKAKIYQKRKDITENTSSEATTPNKKGIKKKKIGEDLIEIVEQENKNRVRYPKRKESVKPPIREIKRREKGKNKSVDKIVKNIANNKREKMTINLNETYSEEEINLNNLNATIYRRPSKKNIRQPQMKRNVSRTPDKKNKKKKEINIPKNNKKRGRKTGDEKLMQFELSSDENENEDTQDKEKVDSGYLSLRKASQSKKAIQEREKSRSTVKSSKESARLLGKKRKNERNVKSKTPNKMNKSQIQIVNKIPIEIKNSPIKMRAGKSSKTPVKNNSKKNRNMFPDTSSINSFDSKNYVTPELAVLNQLIVEFGFEKVLDSLCKGKLNHKNKLDSCVEGLRSSCATEKLPLFLIKMMFSYFEKKDKEKDIKEDPKEEEKLPEKTEQKLAIPELVQINDKEKEKEKEMDEEKDKELDKEKEKEKEMKKLVSVSMLKSASTENTNTNNNELNEFSEKPVLLKEPPNMLQNISSLIANEENSAPIHLTEEEPTDSVQTPPLSKNEKKVPQKEIKEKENKKIDKSPLKLTKEETKKEKKPTSIGSHYHKDVDGLIYKYQVYQLDGKGNALFKCYDDKCSSEGTYDLDSRKFGVNIKHSLKHQEHDYIINYDKGEDNVFKEMSKLNKNDAQVFKEGNERTVKIY